MGRGGTGIDSDGSGAVAAGPHACVELLRDSDIGASGTPELRLTINVPFELASLAEAELDVGPTSVQLRRRPTPSPARESSAPTDDLVVPLPEGFALQPDQASARFSKKRRQLTICSPCSPRQSPASEVAPAQRQEVPRTVAPSVRVGAAHTEAATPATGAPCGMAAGAADSSMGTGDPEDDEDDLPPPLEATRKLPVSVDDIGLAALVAVNAAREASHAAVRASPPEDAAPTGPTQSNEAADALMRKALAAHEQKRKETEEARRKSDLATSGGLKKGFLSSGSHGNKAKKAPRQPQPMDETEVVPYIRGTGDVDASKTASLQLPEVQKALKEGAAQLKGDQSWVTPQLLNALASRPHLAQAMSNPRIQEAMRLMQDDPDRARVNYRDDVEVMRFLKDFSELMATHFDVLGKEAPDPRRIEQQGTTANGGGRQGAKGNLPAAGADAEDQRVQEALKDPAVVAAFRDPEVQALLASLRAGRPLELHELARGNERLFHKMKVLVEKRLIDLQH